MKRFVDLLVTLLVFPFAVAVVCALAFLTGMAASVAILAGVVALLTSPLWFRRRVT